MGRRLEVSELPKNIRLSEDGAGASFVGERLGGNRAVRACSPLPCSAYHALRPQRSAVPASPPPRSPTSPCSVCSIGSSDDSSGCGAAIPAAFRLERGVELVL